MKRTYMREEVIKDMMNFKVTKNGLQVSWSGKVEITKPTRIDEKRLRLMMTLRVKKIWACSFGIMSSDGFIAVGCCLA